MNFIDIQPTATLIGHCIAAALAAEKALGWVSKEKRNNMKNILTTAIAFPFVVVAMGYVIVEAAWDRATKGAE